MTNKRDNRGDKRKEREKEGWNERPVGLVRGV